MRRPHSWLLVWMLLVIPLTALAEDKRQEAKALYQEGTAAYAVGDFKAAAAAYEKAYRLKPDAALLYNAAQASRLAGDREHALLLYQNYLRIHGDQVKNRAEVEQHIGNLKEAIARDDRARTTPPSTTLDPDAATAAKPASSTPPSAVSPQALQVSATPAPRKPPVYKRAWFWGVIGGTAAAIALGVGLGVGLGTQAQDPSPSLGTINAN